MIIDFSTHVCPKSVLNFLKGEGYTNVEPLLRGISSLTDIESRLKTMDKYKIDFQVLTLTEQFCALAKSDHNISFCRIVNDALSELCEKYVDKFVALAIVPLLRINEALEELDRAVNELGLKGAHIFTNVDGKPLDSPEFYPFFEHVQKHDIPIFIHPTDNTYPHVNDYGLRITLSWPFDTTLAVMRLIFGGVIEKYPALKIVTHHLGSMMPYFKARFERGFQTFVEKQGTGAFSKSIEDYLKAFYGDTASVVSGWEPALDCGYALFGPNRIVFGTDYPYDGGELAVKKNLATISATAISEENKRKILETNAKTLLKLEN